MFLRRLVTIGFFVEVGLLLVVLPWSGFWDRNYFAQAWPALGSIVGSNFVRGAVSGLGVLNLLAGFAEIVPIFAARAERDVQIADRADTEVGP